MRGALAALVATIALIAPGAAAAYTTEIEAAGDRLVLARGLTFEGPFGLFEQQGDTVTPLPVGRSRVDFDLDYGHEQLVYKRCPRSLCDLYRYAFAAEREVKLGRLSRSRCSEFQPEVDDEVLVFARDGGRACKPGVYVADGKSAPRRILASTDVEEVELDGGVVVVSAFVGKRPVWGLYKLPATGGKPRVITRGGGNPDRTPPGLHAEELVVDGGVAWWTRGEDNEFTTDWALRRTRVAGGTCDEVYFEDEDITALAVVGGAPVIALDDELRRPDPASLTALDC